MKTFTDTEKQQLQAKIQDEQERQRALRENIQIEKDKESKRSKGIISTVLSVKYGFLLVILCVLAFSVWALMPFSWQISSPVYLSFMAMLGVLFNHIAWHFTKKGWPSRAMKTVACVWMLCVVGYLFWLFKTGGI
ncbi:hypothetical protein F4X33_02570 [Candidatus Poribacteria bacterium]|nr:hypothetical protein [Candidatus Poribacteria bacterium]